MEIVFVLAPSQNRFFFEMAEALVYELHQTGIDASISTEGFPEARSGLVYVLFPPHEYFVLEGHNQKIDAHLLKRTIFISAEQPGTSHFDENVRLAPFAGAVFDINAAGVREYARHGVDARLLRLGYSKHFDRFGPQGMVDQDVVFLGCVTPRRARLLTACSNVLARLRSRIILSDNSRPNSKSSATFLAGEEKFGLLQSSSVILNIHQTDEPYFEWARVLDAIHSGCVVLSEHSTDFAPLVAGEHFVSARPEVLPYTLEALLDDPALIATIRQAAYDFIRTELPLAASATKLAEAAEELDRSEPVTTATPDVLRSVDALTKIDFKTQANRLKEAEKEVVVPTDLFASIDPEVASLRRALKEVRLDLMDMRRLMVRQQLGSPPVVRRSVSTPAYRAVAKPKVSILTALYNHEAYIIEALDSLLGSDYADWEIVVVNDGSSDQSHQAVETWAARHPYVALLLVDHPVNRGLAHARNTALDFARGEYVFVLDSDNAVYPNGIGDLVAALDDDAGASFAYGMLAAYKDGEAIQLVSSFPWEPERLRPGNYIDAMALFRADAVRSLKGYSADRRLYGWEDYDLYCRFAEGGHRGAFVAKMVASYRMSDTSMLAVSNISHSAAYAAVKEHAPTLMAQVVAPL